MIKVLITVINTGWIHKTVCESILDLANDPRHQKCIMFPVAAPPTDNNMNITAELFYKNDFDYWLMFDDDTAPRPGIKPLDLIEMGKDVIGLPYPMAQEGHEKVFFPCVFDVKDGKHIPHRPEYGLQKVDAIGTGAVLLSKKVFENPEMRKHPFLSIYNEKGHRILGPDLSFCSRLRENGFDIWAHYEYPCTHFKEVNIGRFVGVL